MKKEEKRKSIQCPKCGNNKFIATAHVTQDWKIDENGNFLEVVDDCVETTHSPDIYDIWACDKCGYEFSPHEEVIIRNDKLLKMKDKLKSAMDDMLMKGCVCDYEITYDEDSEILLDTQSLDAYIRAYEVSLKNKDVRCYMSVNHIRAAEPVFSVLDGVVRLSGQVI